MKYFSAIILILWLGSFPAYGEECLLNRDYIEEVLTKEAAWCNSHGATGEYLGAGLLYFSLAYAKRAKTCVCLGSGGGFVPRIMRQAQRELGIVDSRTILIDGDTGEWGRPQWLDPDLFFRVHFPDVEIVIDTSHHVALMWDKEVKIDYLHIDADHSALGSWRDFIDYVPFMAPFGVITFYDTNGNLPCAETVDKIKQCGYEVVDFKEIGEGVALIHL